MAYDKEKGKSRKDLWGLKSFYFICVVGAPYYQEGCIGWDGEVWNIENYLPTKIPRNAGHNRFVDRISERFFGHVRPLAWTCLSLTSSSVAKSLTGLIRPLNRILERFVRHVCPPDRTCPNSSLSLGFLAYPTSYPGSREFSRTRPVPYPDMSSLPQSFNG
jgi:hypothetical protein